MSKLVPNSFSILLQQPAVCVWRHARRQQYRDPLPHTLHYPWCPSAAQDGTEIKNIAAFKVCSILVLESTCKNFPYLYNGMWIIPMFDLLTKPVLIFLKFFSQLWNEPENWWVRSLMQTYKWFTCRCIDEGSSCILALYLHGLDKGELSTDLATAGRQCVPLELFE